MFWTIQHSRFGPATLCDRCALACINQAVESRRPDMETFDSVESALVVINAMCAAYGFDSGLDFDFSSSGECGNCETRVIAL